jgi:hypothetical protein
MEIKRAGWRRIAKTERARERGRDEYVNFMYRATGCRRRGWVVAHYKERRARLSQRHVTGKRVFWCTWIAFSAGSRPTLQPSLTPDHSLPFQLSLSVFPHVSEPPSSSGLHHHRGCTYCTVPRYPSSSSSARLFSAPSGPPRYLSPLDTGTCADQRENQSSGSVLENLSTHCGRRFSYVWII